MAKCQKSFVGAEMCLKSNQRRIMFGQCVGCICNGMMSYDSNGHGLGVEMTPLAPPSWQCTAADVREDLGAHRQITFQLFVKIYPTHCSVALTNIYQWCAKCHGWRLARLITGYGHIGSSTVYLVKQQQKNRAMTIITIVGKTRGFR